MKEQIIDCQHFKATLTAYGCLCNRIKAAVLEDHMHGNPGVLKICLTCETGRRVKAYLPGDDQK
jgi:hypothetical protein